MSYKRFAAAEGSRPSAWMPAPGSKLRACLDCGEATLVMHASGRDDHTPHVARADEEPNERHVMEIVPQDPFHQLGGPCWCQPTLEDVPPGGRLVIHRRTLDSPRYETEPPSDFGEQMLSEGNIPGDLQAAIDRKKATR